MRHLLMLPALILGLAIPLTSVAQPVAPQTRDPFVAQHRQKQSEDAPEIAFTIRFKDSQKRFQQGETIRLELLFSSSVASRFSLSLASYDRGGRLAIDDFIVDRERSAPDPLSDYFNSSFGFMGGGLSSSHELDDKPFGLTIEVNEWLRFDEPGHYRLYVVSKRVGRKRTMEYKPLGNPPLSVVSNIIELEIVPADEKWAKEKLVEALTTIESKNDQQRLAGCRMLRFLGTRDAVREIVKRLGIGGYGCDHQLSFGLIGSPHRALVISEMERGLEAANHPVAVSFLRTLAILNFTTEVPGLPPYPHGNEAAIKNWQAMNAERHEKFNKILIRYLGDLVNAIPSKNEDARAVSMQTLLAYHENVKRDGTLAADVTTLLSTLPDVFLRLPLESQTHLLRSAWHPIAKPDMLPVLKEIYEGPKQQEERHFFQERELRSLALTRLYELAPEEGRHLVIEEISRLEPRVNFSALSLLPDEILPELDDLQAIHLEQTTRTGKGDLDLRSALIERYATATILPSVQAFLSSEGVRRWGCRTQSSLLAYIVRVDPPASAEFIAKALASRGKNSSRCYPTILKDVAALHMVPEIEAAAIETLEEDEPEMVIQAAGVLQQYGSARAEIRLWERYERWNRERRQRAADFTKLYPAGPAFGYPRLSDEVAIEEALQKALSKGQGWLADREKLERLRAVCLTQYGLDQIEGTIRQLNLTISIGISPFIDKLYLISLAQYDFDSIRALKNKLLQFPAGTVFKFGSERNAQNERLFQELKSYLEAQGMGLEES